MKIKVTFEFEPEEDEADPDHETGLTNEAWESKTDALMGAWGAEDITFEKVAE